MLRPWPADSRWPASPRTSPTSTITHRARLRRPGRGRTPAQADTTVVPLLVSPAYHARVDVPAAITTMRTAAPRLAGRRSRAGRVAPAAAQRCCGADRRLGPADRRQDRHHPGRSRLPRPPGGGRHGVVVPNPGGRADRYARRACRPCGLPGRRSAAGSDPHADAVRGRVHERSSSSRWSSPTGSCAIGSSPRRTDTTPRSRRESWPTPTRWPTSWSSGPDPRLRPRGLHPPHARAADRCYPLIPMAERITAWVWDSSSRAA